MRIVMKAGMVTMRATRHRSWSVAEQAFARFNRPELGTHGDSICVSPFRDGLAA
jgi:hypothetical protein